ncbi:MAG: hypothetical protein JJ921_02335 [Pseudomonadales bacterium]|nr:hypothetical protein [Pseudomonadales bacterium]MBO7005004.1 hypothetical protein [Pseudomonadales bacterium]
MAHAILPGAAVAYLLSGLSLVGLTIGGVVAGLIVAFSGSLISSMSWRPDGRALAMANAKGGITVFRVRS